MFICVDSKKRRYFGIGYRNCVLVVRENCNIEKRYGKWEIGMESITNIDLTFRFSFEHLVILLLFLRYAFINQRTFQKFFRTSKGTNIIQNYGTYILHEIVL